MRRITQIGVVIAFIAATLPAIQAQSKADPNEQETIIVTSNLVTVNVIVTDRQGRYVRGLKADQFSIYDENVKQKIAHFSVGPAPVSIGIVYEFDATAPQRAASVLTALKQFVSTLGQHDRFFFTAYSATGSVTTDFIPSVSQLMDHLTVVKPGGPAALYDVLYSASDKLRQSPNIKRSLLVISDGQDNHSQRTYKELRNRLREFDAQIYTIGIAIPGVDHFAGYRRWVFEDLTRETGRRAFLTSSEAAIGRAVLAEMSRVSGGTSYSAESESEPELTWICAQIATEFREQYTLGFYPNNITPQRWRKLKVQVDGPASAGVSLSYRKGYQLGGKKGGLIAHVDVWAMPY